MDIEKDPKTRKQENNTNKSGFYGDWNVFAAADFKTGLDALQALSGIKNEQLDNLVIESHGMGGDDPAMKLNDNNSMGYQNFLYNSDLARINGDINGFCNESQAKAAQLQGLAGLVKDNGKLILAICDIGKGKAGVDFANNIATITGNRLNVFLPRGWVEPIIGSDVKTSQFNAWVEGFNVRANPGWLQVTPQGTVNNVSSIQINRTGDPIHLTK